MHIIAAREQMKTAEDAAEFLRVRAADKGKSGGSLHGNALTSLCPLGPRFSFLRKKLPQRTLFA